MSPAELAELYPVLGKLPATLLQRIVDAMQTMSVPAGTVVFDEVFAMAGRAVLLIHGASGDRGNGRARRCRKCGLGLKFKSRGE